MTAFYEWLLQDENINLDFLLWNTNENHIPYKNDYGLEQYRTVVTKDINQVLYSKSNTNNENIIIDGGKLKPLTKEQQITIIKLLNEINNREMTLSFLIALTTGARMQTVFTLRIKHFKQPIQDYFQRVQIGYGTDCDTKYSKRNILFFPSWLYNEIQEYIETERALKRRKKSKHIFESDDFQYVFLTNRGTPYYCAQNDKYRILYSSPPNGEVVRTFIINTLQKRLKSINENFQFSFHDLRATFGVNLFDSYSDLIKEKEYSVTQVLHIIKERMGHSSLKTTELYLNFRNKNKLNKKAQDNYEQLLRELIDESK